MSVTDAPDRGPLELVGQPAGWSVIDPTSVLTRLWYFDGKFLRAEGFRRDQEYVRALVALTGRAVGHGVVHGFTASRATGDRIAVTAGLALTPAGRPLLLTARQDLPIAELIARATGGTVGAKSGRFTPEPEFGACPPDAGEQPPTGGPTPMWVLYARPIEALCGEEERFGQLCEDACATETDRSVVVEGVCFFVEQLNLTLPTSSAVTFGERHLRSRYSSAYYQWERGQVATLISGAGLRSPIWCAGAEGVSGEAVALAVFDRAGGVTTFVDAWTARRELIETSPNRYWHWRMARRPRDVYLAQVLQFQCQLLHLAIERATPVDDCEDERNALAATNEMLTGLTSRFVSGNAAANLPNAEASSLVDADAYTRIAAMQKHVAAVLARSGPGTSGSLLLEGGIVELPSSGYLPVDPQRSVQRQVRAFMGPGVDLRFCAVRPDYIGEAFDEAQHMERISLTQGIDDPGRLEEVDVLVPDGKVTTEDAEASAAFQGILRIRPQLRRTDDQRTTTGAAIALRAVAREHAGESWSWSLAAVGEVPRSVPLLNLLAAVLVDGGVEEERMADAGVTLDEPVVVPFVSDENHFSRISDPSFIQRVSRERYFAQARRARINSSLDTSGLANLAAAVGPDRKLQRDEERPLAVWLDLEIGTPLTAMARGQSAAATLRLSLYSRAKEQPVLLDARMTGTLKVTDIVAGPQSGGIHTSANIETSMSGQLDPLVVFGTHVVDQPPRPFRNLRLSWKVGMSTAGAKVLLLGLGPPVGEGESRVQPTIEATDSGDPRQVQAVASLNLAGRSRLATDANVLGTGAGGRTSYPVARLDLDELPGGLDDASPARALGEAAIDMIAAELALPGRDPSFAPTARQRLLARDGTRERTVRVTATTDWVFFHRRRTKVCEAGVDAPVSVRRYRLHHALARDPADLRRFLALDGVYARTADELPGFEAKRAAARVRAESDLDYVHATAPVSGLGFRPVATLEFEGGTSRMVTPVDVLRNAWRAANRGTVLLLAAAGDIGVGDGEDVVLGRLATVRSSLTDLIDQRRTDVRHLTHIPPEFQGPGLDGAFFTVGFAKPEVEVGGCVTLVKIDVLILRRLASVIDMDHIGDLTLDQILAAITQLGVVPDTFEATFDGEAALLDPAAVQHWWGPVPPSGAVPFADPSHTADDEVALWRARSRAAAAAIGLSELREEVTIADTGHCGAAMFLVTDFHPDSGFRLPHG